MRDVIDNEYELVVNGHGLDGIHDWDGIENVDQATKDQQGIQQSC